MKTLNSKLTIQILNESYQIVEPTDNTASLHETVEYIEKRIQEIGKVSGETNPNCLLMRTTLEIAASLLKTQKDQQTALAHTQDHLDRLRQLVEARIDLLEQSSQWLSQIQPPTIAVTSTPESNATKQLSLKPRRSFHHN